LAIQIGYCQIGDIFVFISSYMITTNDIFNFAFTHKLFTRKDLIANIKSEDHFGSPGTFSEQLNRFLKSG